MVVTAFGLAFGRDDGRRRASWHEHFVDYELSSLIEQWALGTELPALRDVVDSTDIASFRGHLVPRSSFGSVLERHGYARGSSGDGGRIHQHHRVLGDDIVVCLNHTAMSPWFVETEQVAIDHFKVYRGTTALAVEDVPKALLAGIVQQADELAAKGSGFDAKWRSLRGAS